jgi:hypothetical protein
LLNGAALQGASLDFALLQGAELTGAQLQGASLFQAQLQGALLFGAQLQDALLDGAGLWRAQLTDSVAKDLFARPGSPDWSPNVYGKAWTNADYAALRQSIEQAVPEGQNRNPALERVAILDCAQQKLGDTALASCDPAAELPDSVKVWKKMIEAARVDQGAYAKALAAILGGLVCSNAPDRIYVLRGLLRSEPLGEDRLLQTGAEMLALAKGITSPECPVSTALTAADKAAIARAAKTAVSLSKSP